LITKQKSLTIELFRPKLNKKLFKYFSLSGINKKILTDYNLSFITNFSELKTVYQFFYVSDEHNYCGKDSPNYGFYREYLENIKNSEIGYILIPEKLSYELSRHVKKMLRNGNFVLEFRADGYMFIKIV